MTAEAVVRQIGPLPIGRDIVVAKGKDTPRRGGGFRFTVSWEKCRFDILNRRPNAALVYQRYNPGHFADFTSLRAYQSQDGGRDRAIGDAEQLWLNSVSLEWFAQLCRAALLPPHLLEALHARRASELSAGCRALVVQSAGRATVGLAQAAPYENAGWAFHQTYGFPILPAASLKGLALHFLLEEWGWDVDTAGKPREKGRGRRRLDGIPAFNTVSWQALCAHDAGQRARLPAEPRAQHLADMLFGTAEEGEGAITFLDGWPVAAVGWFEVDVLTSHHHEYYGAESGVKPADTDSPNPHCFLVLRPGTQFRLHIGLTRCASILSKAQRDALLDAADVIVVNALSGWGIGGKTAAGYGRMRKPATDGSQP